MINEIPEVNHLLARLCRMVKQPIEVVRPPLELLATKYGIPLESVVYIVMDLARLPSKERTKLRDALIKVRADAYCVGLSLDDYVELLTSTKH